jgi:hypothetical protein
MGGEGEWDGAMSAQINEIREEFRGNRCKLDG